MMSRIIAAIIIMLGLGHVGECIMVVNGYRPLRDEAWHVYDRWVKP